MVSTIIGLDLGTTHIRGIEAEIRNGKPPKIRKIHTINIEEEIVSAGEIQNVDNLANAIKRLVEDGKFKGKYVVGMASGESIETRVMETPWANDESYSRILPHFIKDSAIGDLLEEYYFDSHTLNEYFSYPEGTSEDQKEFTKKQRTKLILASGVKKKFVNDFVAAVEKAGLRPYSLDILPLCLIRAGSGSPEVPESANVVTVEVGGDITTIVVYRNKQPRYIANAPFFGGIRVTSQIAQEVGITLPEAELMKIAFSVPVEQRSELKTTIQFSDGQTQDINYSKFNLDQIGKAENVIHREVSNLINHITDVIDDAFATINDAPFRIILSGGGSGLHTLLPRLQSELGIPTQIIQPFEGKDVAEEYHDQQHIYTPLYGLMVGQNEIK